MLQFIMVLNIESLAPPPLEPHVNLTLDLLTVTKLNISYTCVNKDELVPNFTARCLIFPVSLINLTGLLSYLLEIIKSIVVISLIFKYALSQ